MYVCMYACVYVWYWIRCEDMGTYIMIFVYCMYVVLCLLYSWSNRIWISYIHLFLNIICSYVYTSVLYTLLAYSYVYRRGVFIDQSQSLNAFIPQPDYAKLTSMHFHGWKKGLKTG